MYMYLPEGAGRWVPFVRRGDIIVNATGTRSSTASRVDVTPSPFVYKAKGCWNIKDLFALEYFKHHGDKETCCHDMIPGQWHCMRVLCIRRTPFVLLPIELRGLSQLWCFVHLQRVWWVPEKMPFVGEGVRDCLSDSPFCFIIATTVQLRQLREVFPCYGIILVRPNMGEVALEGEIGAVSHKILQNVGMTAFWWNAMWWKVLYLS